MFIETYCPGVLLRILGYISEAIRGDFVHSKRDIFYQDPLFFGSQGVVNRCIDIITSTVGVGRAALHVVRSAESFLWMATPILTNSGG